MEPRRDLKVHDIFKERVYAVLELVSEFLRHGGGSGVARCDDAIEPAMRVVVVARGPSCSHHILCTFTLLHTGLIRTRKGVCRVKVPGFR